MILFFYGKDSKKVKDKVNSTVDVLLKKQKDAQVFKVDVDSWSLSYVKELLNAQGLFLSKYIIIFSYISENKEYFTEMLGLLEDMKLAEHACIVAEGEITEKNIEKINKFSTKSQEITVKKIIEKKKPEAPTFAFATSFANRDFLKSEKYLAQLLELKLAPEEIHGVLWWQMKAVKLASISHSAVSANLNPFVYKNAKSASQKWNSEDLDQVLNVLFEMYHQAHRGKIDFLNAIERLVVRWGR